MLTAQQQKEIKILQAANEMYERTKQQARMKGSDKSTLDLIDVAQQEVIDHIGQIDKESAKNIVENNQNNNKEAINMDSILQSPKELSFDSFETVSFNDKPISETETMANYEEVLNDEMVSQATASDVQYDVISLPSNGEGYKNKVNRVPVAYLTAYDENFITSPNLYKDEMVIDFLLKNKILNKNINIDDLYCGDADAIILFLRATSYGTDFPIYVTDPTTGQRIETTVDLSTLKTKPFNLKGDENGWFDFTLPLSKDKIKFKFTTRKEKKILDRLEKIENEGKLATLLVRNANDINEALQEDKILSMEEKNEMTKYLDKIKDWSNRVNEKHLTPYSKTITNRLQMAIMSVNGNTDKKFICDYIKNMRAMDSLSLRRYITENEPGIDFAITVERPESLGGGSFATFLEWDISLFLNIA